MLWNWRYWLPGCVVPSEYSVGHTRLHDWLPILQDVFSGFLHRIFVGSQELSSDRLAQCFSSA
jgi:hypothetical protein